MADTRTLPSKCPRCMAVFESPVVCAKCRALFEQPADLDHFTLLGIPLRYALDDSVLNQRYVSLSRSVHPDYFGAAGEETRSLAVRLAARVNAAMRVLKDPVLRAGYLLELHGGDSAADDRSVPPDLLGRVMMMREELEEARAAADVDRLSELRATVSEQRSAALANIAAMAEHIDSAPDDEKQQLRKLLNSMKYHDNLLADLAP